VEVGGGAGSGAICAGSSDGAVIGTGARVAGAAVRVGEAVVRGAVAVLRGAGRTDGDDGLRDRVVGMTATRAEGGTGLTPAGGGGAAS